jgi:outer membrane immunogenic protein
MLKKYLLAGCIAALSIAPAMAADLAVKATPYVPLPSTGYSWTGFYLGLNGGGAFNSNCWSANGALVFGFSPAIAEGCNSAKGATVGGQVGYRYQVSSIVFGLEAQGDWANIKGSNPSALFAGIKFPPGVAVGLTNSNSVDAIGMFTGQIGYAFQSAIGPILLYGKGGVAVTDNKYGGALTFSGDGRLAPLFSVSATDNASAVRFGEVVGAGAEWAFYGGLSLGVEYNHLFMGSQNVGLALSNFSTTPAVVLPKSLLAAGMPTRNDSISGDIDMVSVKLNYKFGAH